MPLLHYYDAAPAVSGPGPAVTIHSLSRSKISRVYGYDASDGIWSADQTVVEYQIRKVANEFAKVTDGTLIKQGAPMVLYEDFEDDVASGFTKGTNGSFTLNTNGIVTHAGSAAMNGTRSWRILASGMSANCWAQAIGPLLPVQPGDVIQASAYIAIGNNAGVEAQLTVAYYNGSTYLGQVAPTTLSNSDGTYTSNYTVPASGVTHVALTYAMYAFSGSNVGGDMWVDRVRLTRTPVPAGTMMNLELSDDDIVAASAAEGANIIKLFAKNAAGKWTDD